MHYGCSLVMSNLVQKAREHNMEPVFFWPVGRDWRSWRDLIKRKCNVDAVIVNGEGSIHHSSKKEKPWYLSEVATFARDELDVPAYLINSTIYQNESGLYDNLRDYRSIFVRESASLDSLKQYGIEATIVPDLTLSYPLNATYGKIKRHGSLVTDSTLSPVSKQLQEYSQALDWDYVRMHGKTGSRIPFKKWKRWLKNLKRRYPVYRKRYKELVDHQQMLRTIRGKEFVLSGRFHAITFCFLTETPFLAIESNTPKISAMLTDLFGTSDRMLLPEEVYTVLEEGRAGRFYTFSDEEIRAIRTYRTNAAIKIDEMFRAISKDIRASS